MKRRYLCFLLILFLSIPLFSQKKLFRSDELVELSLTFDYEGLQKDRLKKSPTYFAAELKHVNEKGDPENFPVQIRVRGAYRKDPTTCNFPPIHIKFNKDTIPKGSIFRSQKKIKVVTHCQLEESILKEYYVYKMYNLFTERSFQVRLAKITYIDSKGIQANETKYAFFIEATKDMASRNEGKELMEEIILEPSEVDRDQMTVTTMFQFMVANKDFTIKRRKNIKIITNKEIGGKPIAVPYDYDWSGIINASYLNLGSKPLSPMDYYLKQRKFNPNKICRTREEYDKVVQLFFDLQPQIYALYENSPYLYKTSIKETLKAYKNFYKYIKSSKNIEGFVDTCASNS